MASPSIADRTRMTADPIRNFKYQVTFLSSDTGTSEAITEIGKMGFSSVSGLSMNTEVMGYREGGWNTNPHKLPGQTDFTPISMSSGVFSYKPGMWNMSERMFAAQWGNGTLGVGTLTDPQEFRFDMYIDVYDHPVTSVGKTSLPNTTKLQFRVYNAFVASVGFGDLNASDNGILVHSMTIHHEGFEVDFKDAPGNNRTGTIVQSAIAGITNALR